MIIRVSGKALIFREGRDTFFEQMRPGGRKRLLLPRPSRGRPAAPGRRRRTACAGKFWKKTGCRITEIRFCGLFEEINVKSPGSGELSRLLPPDDSRIHRPIRRAGGGTHGKGSSACLESIWLPLEEAGRIGQPSAPGPWGTSPPEILKGKVVWLGAQLRGRKGCQKPCEPGLFEK